MLAGFWYPHTLLFGFLFLISLACWLLLTWDTGVNKVTGWIFAVSTSLLLLWLGGMRLLSGKYFTGIFLLFAGLVACSRYLRDLKRPWHALVALAITLLGGYMAYMDSVDAAIK